jgi:melibiose permease
MKEKSLSKLTFKTKYSFGIGALGKDLCYQIVVCYLMIYLTDTIGLKPAFVGTLFLLTKICDALNAPMMGMVIDNTKSKYGKFRPWILIGTLINSVVLILLFTKPNISGTGLYIYFSIVYILWGMTYTIEDISYWSMLPSLSRTKQERDKMSVIPRIFASFATLIVGSAGLWIINRLGSGNDILGYSKISMAIAVAFIITALITVINVKDKSTLLKDNEKVKAHKTSIKRAFKIVWKNDQLRVFIGVVLCSNLVVRFYSGLAIYYFKYVVGNSNMYSVFTGCAATAEMLGLFLYPLLSKTIGRLNVFRIASFIPAIGLIVLLVGGFIVPSNTILIGLSGAMCKLGSGFTAGITTVMIADVIDYGEYKFGTRNESIIASFQTLLVKIASAVVGLAVGVGLTLVGYVANAVQTAPTILGMKVLMIGVPSVITILSYIIYRKGYKLEGEYQDKIIEELNLRREKGLTV